MRIVIYDGDKQYAFSQKNQGGISPPWFFCVPSRLLIVSLVDVAPLGCNSPMADLGLAAFVV